MARLTLAALLASLAATSGQGGCGMYGFEACTSFHGDKGVLTHSCNSPSSQYFTIGALPSLVAGGAYMCMECSLPNQRACECTDVPAADGTRYYPCQKGETHWCQFGPQMQAITHDDGTIFCEYNVTSIIQSYTTACGNEGQAPCRSLAGPFSAYPGQAPGLFNVTFMIDSCTSPDADGNDLTAMPLTHDPISEVACMQCGRTGMRACNCNTDPTPDGDNDVDDHPCRTEGTMHWCRDGQGAPFTSVSNNLTYCVPSGEEDNVADWAAAEELLTDETIQNVRKTKQVSSTKRQHKHQKNHRGKIMRTHHVERHTPTVPVKAHHIEGHAPPVAVKAHHIEKQRPPVTEASAKAAAKKPHKIVEHDWMIEHASIRGLAPPRQQQSIDERLSHLEHMLNERQ